MTATTEIQVERKKVHLRAGKAEDAPECGRICYQAFADISDRHHFACDFPNQEIAVDLMRMLLVHPNFFSLVAEMDGQVLGSNFLDERSSIAGLGPITVAPEAQNRRVGDS